MSQPKSPTRRRIRYFHEIAFSLNLALVFTALLFQSAPWSLISFLHNLEFSLNRLFHIPQTDFVRGYWEFFLPGILFAVLIWATLKRICRSRPATGAEMLRVPAGLTAIGLAPLWWICATYILSHTQGLFGAIQVYELAFSLFCAILYLLGRWPVPAWASLLALLLHYAFWLWQFRPLLTTFLRGWGGSVAVIPFVALIAGLAWALYVSKPREAAPPLQL